MAVDSFDLASSVRRYNVYQQLWNPQPGETLNCRRERNNREDFYAVAVMKSEEVVGHVPRFLSCIVSLFLRRGGSVTCRVSGYRQYSMQRFTAGRT